MTSGVNSKETPNLLELAETYLERTSKLDDLSVCGDEIGLASSLTELSLCADEALRSSLSERSLCGDELDLQAVCADEGPSQLSVCADEATSPADLSLCADEGPAGLADLSVCADEIVSDIRLKTDIEQVGTTVYGLPLYHFRYKTGTERFQGVMAQDVLEVMPDAVVLAEDGYYRVKYSQLGIGMTRA